MLRTGIGILIGVVLLALVLFFSDNIKAAVKAFLGDTSSITVERQESARTTGEQTTRQEVTSSAQVASSNPMPEGGWVESDCYYRSDFGPFEGSGKSVSSGYVLEGPAFFIPLRGPKAFWPEILFVEEGQTITAAVNGVTQEYEFNTGCRLIDEVENSPARNYYPITQ